MIDKQRLEAKCSTWNIALTGTQLDQLDAPYAHAEDGRQNPGSSVTATAEGSPPLGGCPAGASHTGSPFCAGLCAKQEDQGQKAYQK